VSETYRLVVVALPAMSEDENMFVVVALVPVAFTKVKFWRVEEPLTKRFWNVPVPLEVKFPPVPVVKKRLVLEAVEAKKFVVVALVPVALIKVKFWRVVEPLTRRLAKVATPDVKEVEKRLVEEAVVE
jgi:hypothetical protein